MKSLEHVLETRKRRYEQTEFILMLRDDALSPQDRLSYAPFAVQWVMAFTDANLSSLREDACDDPVQQAINEHTREDSTHFEWYLSDLRVLGFDASLRYSDWVRFAWSGQGVAARDLGYFLNGCARKASPRLRMVLIESVEATGRVWLQATSYAARNHPSAAQLRFFGPHHLERESGHLMLVEPTSVPEVVLSSLEREEGERLVHGLFDRMEAFCNEMTHRTRRALAEGAIHHFTRF